MDNKTDVKQEQLTILREMGEIFSSSFDLSSRLTRVLELAIEMLRVDSCIIYLLDEWAEKLILTAFQGSCGPCSLGESFPLETGFPSLIVKEKKTIVIENILADERVQSGPGFPENRFKSCMGMPIMDGLICLGVIVAQTEDHHEFSTEERSLFSIIAKQASVMIRNSLVYSKARRMLGNLSALYRLGSALNSTLNLQEVLLIISDYSAEVTKARGCILRLLTETGHSLKIEAISKIDPQAVNRSDVQLGHDVAGLVARLGDPILIEDVNNDPRFVNTIGVVKQSVLCVPIKMRNEMIGTIKVFDKDKSSATPYFDSNDLELLTAFANHAVVALDNARLYQKSRQLAESNITKVKKLMILNEISTALRQTLDFDQRIKIILSGVTLGSGFGFNRAILLLLNEDEQMLEGAMGIGPSSPDEAAEIWQWFEKMDRPLSDWLIDQATDLNVDESYNILAKSLRIPILQGENVFSEAVNQLKTFNVPDAAHDPLVPHELYKKLQSNAFAVIPLLAKDRVLGVLEVDNLFNREPILEEDLTFLEMLANHAAFSLDGAQVYTKLEQANLELIRTHDLLVKSERLAAVGQLAASIVHEIRNPLVPIGGFARRLRNLVSDKKGIKYSDIIIKEVKRLETFLDDVLGFSRELELTIGFTDINNLVSETLFLLQEGFLSSDIKVEIDMSPELPDVSADKDQIKQVLLNVLKNAEEAINFKGTINVKTFADESNPDLIKIIITDTGPGIPEEIKHDIFNPFFTTKSAGTGLGLALANKIITKHGGSLIMTNRSDSEGAQVEINLSVHGPNEKSAVNQK